MTATNLNKKNSPFLKTRSRYKNPGKTGVKTNVISQNDSVISKKCSTTPTNNNETKKLVQGDNTPLFENKKTIEKSSKIEENYLQSMKVLEAKYDLLLQENKQLKQHVDQIKGKLEVMGQTWLWDDTINTYFEVLTLNIIGKKGKIYLMNPVVVEAVKGMADTKVILDPLSLREKDILLIPINNAEYDNTDKNSYKNVKGSHWSLLVYKVNSNQHYYYDSLKSNRSMQIAGLVCNKLSKYFEQTIVAELITIQGPKQDNTYDCGVFMLHAVDYILQNYKSDDDFVQSLTIPHLSEVECVKKRAFIAYVITNNFSAPKSIIQSLIHWPQHTTPNSENKDSKKAMKKGDMHIEQNLKNAKPLETQVEEDLKRKLVNTGVQTDLLRGHNESVPKPVSGNSNLVRDKGEQIISSLQTNQQKTKKAITILSDSHGRKLDQLIKEKCNENVEINNIIMPGAGIDHIMQEAKHVTRSKSNHVILIAGANNIYNGHVDSLCKKLKSLVLSLKPCKVTIASVPFRKDLPLSDKINENIMNFNLFIHEISHALDFTSFLDLTGFPKKCFERSGVHFNYIGKKIIAAKILQQVLPHLFKSSTISDSLSKGISTYTSTKKSQGISPSTKFGSSFFSNRNQILVNDEHMGSVISSFRKDPTVAFSHCISADLGEERHMSAGVAVVFAKMFGKPSNINMLTPHLTHQQENSEAGVYGLITKPKYNSKPTIEDYDIAFDHLSRNFKEKNFKHLICSPMGCMRDKIKLEHFVNNLVKFQRETGATVNIITYSKYWNKSRFGMSYDEFSRILNMHIHNYKNTPQHLPNLELNFSTVSNTSLWRGWSSPEIRSCPGRTVCSTPLTPRTSPHVAPGDLSYSEVIKRQLSASVFSEGQSYVSILSGAVGNQNRFLFLDPHQSPPPIP